MFYFTLVNLHTMLRRLLDNCVQNCVCCPFKAANDKRQKYVIYKSTHCTNLTIGSGLEDAGAGGSHSIA